MEKGNIMRDVISSSRFTANVIKEYKKRSVRCNKRQFGRLPSDSR